MLWIVGCSTTRDSKPTVSTEKAANAHIVTATLEDCAQYHIPDGATVARGAVKPWVNCLELALRDYPDLQQSEGLVALFRALVARKDDGIRDVPGVNALVHSVFHAVQAQGAEPCSAASQRVALQELPGYALHLARVCSITARTIQPSPVAVPEELGVLGEDLRSALAGTGDDRASKIKFESQGQRKYCESFREHVSHVSDLRDLLSYRDLLASHSRSAEEKQLKARLEERIASLKNEGLSRHEELEKEYAALSLVFSKSSCFFGDGIKKQAPAVRHRKKVRRKKGNNA